jgi:hypothetical protein
MCQEHQIEKGILIAHVFVVDVAGIDSALV